MSFTNKVLGGLFWGQLGMSMRSLLCFLISVFVARSLGAADFGVYSALVSLIAMLLRFTDMGVYSVFNNYLPHFSGQNRQGEGSYLIRKVLQLKTLFFLFLSLALYAGIDTIVGIIGQPQVKDYVVLLIIWFLVRGFAEVFIYIVMSRMEMKYYSFVEVTTSIFQFLGVYYLMETSMNIEDLIILAIAVYLIQCFAYMYGSRHSFMTEPEKTEMKPIAKYALVIWLSGLLQYFLNSDVDIYLILYFLKDPSLAGYYSVAYLLAYTGGDFLRTAVNTLSLTILSESNATQGMDGMKRSCIFLYKMSVILAGPILAFMLFQSGNIIHGIYSTEYDPAGDLLALFSLFFLGAMLFGTGPVVTMLLPLNKENWVLYLRGGGGILNLALNVMLIPLYGVMGAVVATGLAFVILAATELLIVVRLTKLEVPWWFLAKSIAAMTIPASLTLFFGEMGLILLVVLGATHMYLALKLIVLFSPMSQKEIETLEDFSPKIHTLLQTMRII